MNIHIKVKVFVIKPLKLLVKKPPKNPQDRLVNVIQEGKIHYMIHMAQMGQGYKKGQKDERYQIGQMNQKGQRGKAVGWVLEGKSEQINIW